MRINGVVFSFNRHIFSAMQIAVLSNVDVYTYKCILFSGLFVDVQHPYLAASPDGVLADEFAVLEVKCPYSGREEKIKPGKNFPFLEERDGNFCLKRGHNYYYQCMGQMFICKKTALLFCYIHVL